MIVVPFGIGVVAALIANFLPSRVGKLAAGALGGSLAWAVRASISTELDSPFWFFVLSLGNAAFAFASIWLVSTSFRRAKPAKTK